MTDLLIVQQAAAVLSLASIPVALGAGAGFLVQAARKKPRRSWAIVAGSAAAAFVACITINRVASWRRHEAAYASATELLAQGQPRAAIPRLVEAAWSGNPRDTEKLAEARGIVKADVAAKLDQALAKVDSDPAGAKQAAAAAMTDVDADLLGKAAYAELRARADNILKAADESTKLAEFQRKHAEDAVADEATAKKKAEEAAVGIAEAKKRLADRKFIGASPEGIGYALLAKNDPAELWETSYQGKYVRWQGKFERTGFVVKFIASATDQTSMSCKDFNATQDKGAFDEERAAKWTRLAVEGKLDRFEKQFDKNKLEFVLSDCIVKTL